MSITQKMEGGGKVKKLRARTKPFVKNSTSGIISPTVEGTTITPGNSGEVAIETTTGNAGEVTVETSGEKTTEEEEEENPLLKIIRYVHYNLFERIAVYCDGCKHQFGDIATGIISDQSLEMYKKRVNQGVQEGICQKNDCFVGNTLRFILYYFPAACKDVAYAKYGNEMTEKVDLLLDAMRDFVLSYISCTHPFDDSKHYTQKICKIILDVIISKYYVI